MTLIYNLWNRFKIREVHDLFSFSFRRNVGYNRSEIFSTNRVLRFVFVFVFVTVRGGVSTKTKTSTRFVFVFVGRLGLALDSNVLSFTFCVEDGERRSQPYSVEYDWLSPDLTQNTQGHYIPIFPEV